MLVVTCGIFISTFSSSNIAISSPDASLSEWTFGVMILTIALILSCFLGQYQQVVYSKYGPQWREGLFYTHILSIPAFILFRSDLQDQIQTYNSSQLISPIQLIQSWFKLDHETVGMNFAHIVVPILWLYLLFNVITQCHFRLTLDFCISGVHKLSSLSNSVTLNLVLTLRKSVSLLLSVAFFGHPFGIQDWVGALFAFVGTLIYSIPDTKQHLNAEQVHLKNE